jgi:hypothetical protein
VPENRDEIPDDLSGFETGEVSKLVSDAIAMHEILTALMKGGWTERQAITYLVELGERRNRG